MVLLEEQGRICPPPPKVRPAKPRTVAQEIDDGKMFGHGGRRSLQLGDDALDGRVPPQLALINERAHCRSSECLGHGPNGELRASGDRPLGFKISEAETRAVDGLTIVRDRKGDSWRAGDLGDGLDHGPESLKTLFEGGRIFWRPGHVVAWEGDMPVIIHNFAGARLQRRSIPGSLSLTYHLIYGVACLGSVLKYGSNLQHLPHEYIQW